MYGHHLRFTVCNVRLSRLYCMSADISSWWVSKTGSSKAGTYSTSKERYTYLDLLYYISIHFCPCVQHCFLTTRFCSRGVQCLLLLANIPGMKSLLNSVFCHCCVVNVHCFVLSHIPSVGYTGDVLFIEETKILGQPGIQFQGLLNFLSCSM